MKPVEIEVRDLRARANAALNERGLAYTAASTRYGLNPVSVRAACHLEKQAEILRLLLARIGDDRTPLPERWEELRAKFEHWAGSEPLCVHGTGIESAPFKKWQGDTLSGPLFEDEEGDIRLVRPDQFTTRPGAIRWEHSPGASWIRGHKPGI